MKPTTMQAHPEGGRFEEVFRSQVTVTSVGKGRRSALTHIYFELEAADVSRFHQVTSDEIWNLYEGRLRLFVWDGTDSPVETHVLSPQTRNYCHIVRAGDWQAAEPVDGPALVGCSVAPGFDFADFAMLKDRPEIAARFESANPQHVRLL